MNPDDIHKAVETDQGGRDRSKPRVGRDPVNQPMIRHWVDAIGDDNPIYVDEAAAQDGRSSRCRRSACDDPGVDDDGPRR